MKILMGGKRILEIKSFLQTYVHHMQYFQSLFNLFSTFWQQAAHLQHFRFAGEKTAAQRAQMPKDSLNV
jgi:hypothetical protein